MVPARLENHIVPMLSPSQRRNRYAVVAIFTAVFLLALSLHNPMPIAADYHVFADSRTLIGLDNCLDVLSNVPFIIVGVQGVLWLALNRREGSFASRQEKLPYLVFYIGVTLTGFGSFWYHMRPNDERLPFDLLPMTWSFMSILTAAIVERISIRFGMALFGPLLLLGSASVGYWYLTQSSGHGDYRFYLFVQFFSPLLIGTIIVLFPSRYTGLPYLVAAFLFFVLAKLFEMFDHQIYDATAVVSGHSLKHVTAAVACLWIWWMLRTRVTVSRHDDGTSSTRSATTQQFANLVGSE